MVNESLRHHEVAQFCIDPSHASYIPPEISLRRWQDEIEKGNKLATDIFYYESDLGIYNSKSVQTAIQIHKAKAVAVTVEKELDWFTANRLLPKNVKNVPSITLLNNFKSLIHNHPYNLWVLPYNMFPGELARISGDRYLSCDHMLYFTNKLNALNNDTLSIYGNYVRSPQACITRLMKGRSQVPSKVCHILNVGRNKNGDTFIGSDHRQGCHFSLVVVDRESKSIVYGDSLGWKPPNNLYEYLGQFHEQLYPEEELTYVLSECHSSQSGDTGHKCDNKCSVAYPLQHDGYVCGVVVIIMLSLAVLEPSYFKNLLSIKMFNQKQHPFNFLKDPTKYRR